MIRLRDLLEDIEEPKERRDDEDDNHEIHVVPASNKFKARNSKGDVRYFKDRQDARDFLEKGTHHPHDIKNAQPKERKQKKDGYDLR